MLGDIWKSIKADHALMMAACCILPIILIAGFQFAGIIGWWLYPLAMLACVGGHVLMMSGMEHSKEGKKSCH